MVIGKQKLFVSEGRRQQLLEMPLEGRPTYGTTETSFLDVNEETKTFQKFRHMDQDVKTYASVFMDMEFATPPQQV